MWTWIKKWFKKEEPKPEPKPEKPKVDLTGLTKGDIKKLKAQGKL